MKCSECYFYRDYEHDDAGWCSRSNTPTWKSLGENCKVPIKTRKDGDFDYNKKICKQKKST